MTEKLPAPRSVYMSPEQDRVIAAFLERPDVNVNFSFLVRQLLRKHLAELPQPVHFPDDRYGQRAA